RTEDRYYQQDMLLMPHIGFMEVMKVLGLQVTTIWKNFQNGSRNLISQIKLKNIKKFGIPFMISTPIQRALKTITNMRLHLKLKKLLCFHMTYQLYGKRMDNLTLSKVCLLETP